MNIGMWDRAESSPVRELTQQMYAVINAHFTVIANRFTTNSYPHCGRALKFPVPEALPKERQI
jgi:hypothetical protein